MATAAFKTLFGHHAMASYAKQLALADAIENAGAWDLDLQAGTLSFAKGPKLQIGLLGSYGEGAGSWLWAWANKNMGPLPDGNAATKLREIGRTKDIPELHEPETHDAESFCHELAMIAVGETQAAAYYRAPYEGGAAYLTIHTAIPPTPDKHRLGRVQRVIAESTSTFEMNHRTALDAYFKSEGLPVKKTGENEIIASAEDGDIRIRFDADGRITEMKSLLRASTKPTGGFFNRLFRKDKNS